MFQPDLAEQQDTSMLQRKNNFHSSTQLGNEVVILLYHDIISIIRKWKIHNEKTESSH